MPCPLWGRFIIRGVFCQARKVLGQVVPRGVLVMACFRRVVWW